MTTLNDLTAIYPISANPPTNGHLNILERVTKKFKQVYWIAGKNPSKKLNFTNEERVSMMQDYVSFYGLKNVIVDCFDGAIIRYAEQRGIHFLIRGLRNATDFQQEFIMAAGNKGINDSIETVCFFADLEFASMSSSIVIELALLGENIDKYVIPSVAALLRQKTLENPMNHYFC